jgi:hypothetical protein
MSWRFRQSFRLWKGASVSWSAPLRGKSSNAAKGGCGCLLLGMLAVTVLAGLLGKIADSVSSSPDGKSLPVRKAVVVQSEAESLSDGGVRKAVVIPEALSGESSHKVVPAVPLKVAQAVLPSPRVFFEQLNLAKLGFSLSQHKVDINEPRDHGYWTIRKTDPTREYTAIFLQDRTTGIVTALTLELVTSAESPNALATTYFKTLGKALLPDSDKKPYEDWLAKAVLYPASATFGGFNFTTAQASESHRRVTIQPTLKPPSP